jgi:SAM-dependent methyltransferase
MEQSEYGIMFKQENEFWWYRGLHSLVGYYIKTMKKSNAAIALFDAGCGTGRMLEIAKKYATVSGVDFSEDAVAFCRERNLENVTQGDLNTWKCRPELYDIVCSLDVLCHTSIINQQEIIDKFADSLKPGGMLILNLPAFQSIYRNHDRAVHTARRYVKRDLETLLQKSGFKVIFNNYRLPPLFLLVLVKRLFEKKSEQNKMSDLFIKINPVTNFILYCYNMIENCMQVLKIPMPFGTSVFTVAVKK